MENNVTLDLLVYADDSIIMVPGDRPWDIALQLRKELGNYNHVAYRKQTVTPCGEMGMHMHWV